MKVASWSCVREWRSCGLMDKASDFDNRKKRMKDIRKLRVRVPSRLDHGIDINLFVMLECCPVIVMWASVPCANVIPVFVWPSHAYCDIFAYRRFAYRYPCSFIQLELLFHDERYRVYKLRFQIHRLGTCSVGSDCPTSRTHDDKSQMWIIAA